MPHPSELLCFSVFLASHTQTSQRAEWAKLTVHFRVGLPFVIPAPERLAVVLCTLLGPEVHSIRGAWTSVAQLVETAGAGAEFTIVLRPVRKTRQKAQSRVFYSHVMCTSSACCASLLRSQHSKRCRALALCVTLLVLTLSERKRVLDTLLGHWPLTASSHIIIFIIFIIGDVCDKCYKGSEPCLKSDGSLCGVTSVLVAHILFISWTLVEHNGETLEGCKKQHVRAHKSAHS